MNNKTNEDYEASRNKQVAKMRSTMDYAMGALIMILGFFIIKKYGKDVTLLVFGIISMAYGLWRIYRGYKKNYF